MNQTPVRNAAGILRRGELIIRVLARALRAA